MSLNIEKDFLSNVDYLKDLSLRVRHIEKIDSMLLSEIVCARSYIKSTKLNDELKEILSALDIIIAESKNSVSAESFKNPLFDEPSKASVILYNIMDFFDFVMSNWEYALMLFMIPVIAILFAVFH